MSSIVAVLLALCCCGGPRRPHRVLLIGVDGLEWSVIAPLIRQGDLPNLRSLMKHGVYGKLDTIDPTLSPVVWTTIATGKLPDQHGIHHFVRAVGDTGRFRLYNRLDRRVRAFWNILSDGGRKVDVVGWFLTYPAEPVRGFMVSQYTTLERATEIWKGTLEEGVPNQTYPESLLDEIRPDIRAVPGEMPGLERRIFGVADPATGAGNEAKLVQQTLWALQSDALYGRIAERILKSNPDFDVMAVYFGGTDVVGHRFWRYYRPDEFRFPPSEEQRRRYGGVIPDYYRYIDEWIGRLRSACGPEVTTLVLSDHGMAAINRDVDFSEIHGIQQLNSAHHQEAAHAPGIIVAAGPGIRSLPGADLSKLDPGSLEHLGSVLEITPTLLYLEGMPVAEDMAAGPMTSILDERFESSHPVQTVATYERPGDETGGVATDPALEREMMERFKSLGYFGD